MTAVSFFLPRGTFWTSPRPSLRCCAAPPPSASPARCRSAPRAPRAPRAPPVPPSPGTSPDACGPWLVAPAGARAPATARVLTAPPAVRARAGRGSFAGCAPAGALMAAMPKRAMALRGGAPAKEGDAVPDVVFKARVRDEKVPRTPPPCPLPRAPPLVYRVAPPHPVPWPRGTGAPRARVGRR